MYVPFELGPAVMVNVVEVELLNPVHWVKTYLVPDAPEMVEGTTTVCVVSSCQDFVAGRFSATLSIVAVTTELDPLC